MSDETATEATETTETTQDNQQQNEGKPAGYLPVDLSDLPEEKQKALDDRINYLYRQVKDSSRTISEYRSIAQLQSDKINELMNGMGQVVDHLHTKSVAENEDSINQRMQAAFEVGDTKAYLAEQKKLINLEAQKIVAQQQKPQNQNRQMANAGQPQENTQIDPYVNAWQSETDERGQSLRPWARTDDPNDPDPDFLKALAIAKRVWTQNPNRSQQENLAEVDRQMGVKKNGGGQNVMGGSLNTQQKRAKIVLSPQQERIAVKTKFGGKEAKSDADHIAAYRKQIETVQSKTRGAR